MASHGGSNMQAIIDAIKSGKIDAEAACLISNNSNSGAMERAAKEQIAHYHISSKTHSESEAQDQAIIDAFKKHNVNIIVLAGYMRKLSSRIIREWQGRILNIHPALLPAFGGKGMWGMNVHKAVIAAGEEESGATVHIVDEQFDHGRILEQMEVSVMPDDTPEILAARVLEKEHKLYPLVLAQISEGLIEL